MGTQVGRAVSSALAMGRTVSHHSAQRVFLLSRVMTCGEGKYRSLLCQKQHFLFSKVDYKSRTFICVIFRLFMLIMRLVITYAGSLLTQGLRSFLFILLIFSLLAKRGKGREQNLAVELEGRFSQCFHELTQGGSPGAHEREDTGRQHPLCIPPGPDCCQRFAPGVGLRPGVPVLWTQPPSAPSGVSGQPPVPSALPALPRPDLSFCKRSHQLLRFLPMRK